MSSKRRQFSQAFKLQLLREVEAGKSLAQAAREHELHPNLIRKWREQRARYAEAAFAAMVTPILRKQRAPSWSG